MIISRNRIASLSAGLCCAALVAGCQTDNTDWGKVAGGVAIVAAGSGVTKSIDPKVAQVSAELARYCPMLQIAAAFGTASLPESKRAIGLQASAAFGEVCASLPADVPAAIIVAEKAIAAAKAAGVRTAPS